MDYRSSVFRGCLSVPNKWPAQGFFVRSEPQAKALGVDEQAFGWVEQYCTDAEALQEFLVVGGVTAAVGLFLYFM